MGSVLLSGAVLLVVVAAPLLTTLPRQSQSGTTPEPGAGSGGTTSASAARSPGAAKHKIPCKTLENASLCYWTRGRLAVYQGGAPSYRLWKIGTRRILGIFNGPSHFPPTIEEDDQNPELPARLLKAYESDNQRMKRATGISWTIPPPVFADFEVCPLEPERKGWMQAACVESARNIFVEPDD
jgi:hypothetical protein